MAGDDESDRRRVLKGLDRAEAVVVHVYGWILVAVVVFVTVLVAGLVTDLPVGFGTQGEWFYLGIVLLLFAAWIVSQFVAISRRLRRSSDVPDVPSARIETQRVGTHGRRFTLTLGADPEASEAGASPPSSSKTFSWSWSATSLPAEDRLDDEATARATALSGAGHDLDGVCRSLNARYATWDDERRAFFRSYVQAMIDARRG